MQFFEKCQKEYEHTKISEKAMSSCLIRSLFVVVACLVGLSFSAYAWFTFDISSAPNTIVAAEFDIETKVSTLIGGVEGSTITPAGDVYVLPAGTYRAELSRRPGSDAKNGFGIVKVTVGTTKTEYHTQQIPWGTALVLELNLLEPAKIEFIPCWGTSCYFGSGGNPLYLETNDLEIGNVLGSINQIQKLPQEPEQIVYTVVEGDSLSAIAVKFGTTIEAISLLNDIADQQTIYIDQQLIIPTSKTE